MYNLMRRLMTLLVGLIFVIVAVPLIMWILYKTGVQTSMWMNAKGFFDTVHDKGLGTAIKQVAGPIVGGGLLLVVAYVVLEDLLDGPGPRGPRRPRRYDDRYDDYDDRY